MKFYNKFSDLSSKILPLMSDLTNQEDLILYEFSYRKETGNIIY